MVINSNFVLGCFNALSLGFTLVWLWRAKVSQKRINPDGNYKRQFVMFQKGRILRLEVRIQSATGKWAVEKYFEGHLGFINQQLARYYLQPRVNHAAPASGAPQHQKSQRVPG